mmetsp:Transcript_23419/g.53358  ORF Transcript_23419/g.53358 Transcript_23419/m.53358 type:complete len:516 (-) Transcript_23419:342-1889(-)
MSTYKHDPDFLDVRSEDWYPRLLQSTTDSIAEIASKARFKKEGGEILLVGIEGDVQWGRRTKYEWLALIEDIDRSCVEGALTVRPKNKRIDIKDFEEEVVDWVTKKGKYRRVVICSCPARIGDNHDVMDEVMELASKYEEIQCKWSKAGNTASNLFGGGLKEALPTPGAAPTAPPQVLEDATPAPELMGGGGGGNSSDGGSGGGLTAPTGIVRLFHGTTADVLSGIQDRGHLRPSTDGFFGPGVYLTSSREKAAAWANFKAKGSPTFLQSNGWGRTLPSMPLPEPPRVTDWDGALKAPVVVEVQVDVGRCKAFDMTTVRDEDYFYYMPHNQAGVQPFLIPKGLKYDRIAARAPNRPLISGTSCSCLRCYHAGHRQLASQFGEDFLVGTAQLGWDGAGLRNHALCATTCRGVAGPAMLVGGKPTPTSAYPIKVTDEFGRLVSFDGRGFWCQQHNETRSWLDEGFDSQYVPETLPAGAETLDVWPGCVERFAGDEYVVADGSRVIYRSFRTIVASGR